MILSFPIRNILVVILGCVLLTSCFRFRTSDTKTMREFKKKQAEVNIKRYDLKSVDYPVRVVSGAHDANQRVAILFVHGAPGASDNYYKYLQDSALLSKANMYSIDRPGYGFSNFGKAETSIVKQSEVVAEVIDSLPEQYVVVLGHSYGGPIAAYSSLLSSKVKRVIMLAPAIDPENEKIFWIAYISKWKLTKWMVPGALGVAGDEKFTHEAELEKLKDIWKTVKTPVLQIHGTKDAIVPFANLDFATKAFRSQSLDTIVLQKGNHFIPWKNYDLVKAELIKILDQLEDWLRM